MDDIPESSITLAWIWVIEALASFKEIDVSIIHDVIELAPELPDEEGKKATEIVAFRCLESLFGRRSVVQKTDASMQNSKIRFDSSESCKDVLQRILNETSESDIRMGGPGMLRWDVSTFISHKRSHLPKCELRQLKDTILDDTHPYADFLKEKSGLTCTDKNIRIPADNADCIGVKRSTKSDVLGVEKEFVLENQNDSTIHLIIEEGPLGCNTLLSKRNRIDLPSTSTINHGHESHDVIYGDLDDDVPINPKRHKQLSTPPFSDKFADNAETHGCHLVKDQIVTSEKCTYKTDVAGKCTSLKRIQQNDNFHKDDLGKTDASFIAQEACGGESDQYMKELTTGLDGVMKNPPGKNGDENLLRSVNNEHLEEVEISLGENDAKMAEHVHIVHNLDDCKGDCYESNKRIEEIVLSNQGQEEAGSTLVVNHEQKDDTVDKHVCTLNIDKESSEKGKESMRSRYSIRLREPKNHDTYPSSSRLRRKIVPWTTEEEEILKEGVRKFYTAHENSIPWMRILEFGSAVFFKGRTPVDLKDKWRNISRSKKFK